MGKLKADSAMVMVAHPGVMLRSEVQPASKSESKTEDVSAEERSPAFLLLSLFPKNLEDISRKGFSTGLSYMYSSLSEVSQWCKTVDYLGKRRKITLISDFGEISGSRGMERQILYLISKSSYNTSSNRITCWKNIMLTHVPHGQGPLRMV
ncbi:putative ATP synthase protein YMF19 [Phragmites australis]|uniref:putative ATP synthase protein YMF19 n=1 Tax=Phragmites australis TaxID=29695 RepID=UPI002D77B858|nr:putative ATP synthase protein YMF19 [Phragmites australis]